MSDLFKKPYEISLWDDEIIWRRQLLKSVELDKKTYKIGFFYSALNPNDSSVLYVLDYEPYDENKDYYEPDENQITSSDNKVLYPYKESWNISDLNAYNENNEKQLPDSFYNDDNSLKPSIIFQYFKEKKICIIGSNTMNTPVRAFNPKFTTNVNGSSTLTFQVFYRYYDDETDEFISNPFLKLLVNERKVKLKYDGKWYDLIIKNIQENSDQKTFTYTCQDMFITELSKTGFDIQLDAELENNTGTVIDLAKTVMKGTDWKIGDDPGLKQYKNESLYELTLDKAIEATKLLEDASNASQIITAGEKIHAFYTDIESQLSTLQFLYISEKDEDGKLILKYDDNYIITNGVNCEITGVEYTNGAPTFTKKQENGEKLPLKTLIEYQGKKLIRKEKVVYDSKIDKYVNYYSGKDDKGKSIEVYGYTETEYISPTAVKNYIANGRDFETTTGWSVGILNSDKKVPTLSLNTDPTWDKVGENDEITALLDFDVKDYSDQVLVNSGINLNRSAIRQFSIGEKYVFRIKTLKGKVPFNIQIASYKLDALNNLYTIEELYFDSEGITVTSISNEEEDWPDNSHIILECKKSLSYEEFLDTRIGIFIIPAAPQPDYLYKIVDVQFFPYKTYEDENGKTAMATPDGDFVNQAKIKTKYFYYDKNSKYTSLDDIQYLYTGYEQSSNYTQLYYDDFTKIRSVTASESNRFNIIQDLCEIFECWAKFETKHDLDTGEIVGTFKDGKYCPDKTIVFNEYQGKQNAVGFKYGINLKSIQRTLDSAGISSKLIVKNNANEFGKNGFCSIARAKENPSGENFIFDFGHYISQGLVSLMEVNNDLRLKNTAQGYIGLYPLLKEQNKLRDILVEEQASVMIDIMNYQADYTTWSTARQQAEEELLNKNVEIQQMTKKSYDELKPDYWEAAPSKEDLKTNLYYTLETDGTDKTYKLATDWNENVQYYLKNTWKDNEEALSILTAIAKLNANIPRYKKLETTASDNLTSAEKLKQSIDSQLKQITDTKEAIISQFYTKYSRFIQEGSWISEDYVDDNLYYLDAENTLHASSQPKVTYTINVLELSQLEGYENLHFEVGDVSYIEDTEFFGWVYKDNNIKTPHKEEIIVNEITYALDSPEQNTVKVQNYKTQFEDLFQRITATSQTVEYATGRVNKAVSIVKEDGTIKISTLENSFANNAITLQNAKDQSVIINEEGITTTSLARPSEMLRLVSGGLFLSGDGGQTWTTGISSNGINANHITSGVIDTNVIRILNGNNPTFVWNKNGLNAYRFDETTGIFPNTFVRFDQYGLYGISNYSTDGAEFNPTTPDKEGGPIGEAKIKDNSTFALTWSGLQLGSRKNGGYISVSAENDFQVFQIKENSVLERIKIGKLGNNSYGIYFKNDADQITLQTDNSGNLNLSGYLGISGQDTYKARFGMLNIQQNNANKILTVQGHANTLANLEYDLAEEEAIAMYDDGTFVATRLVADYLQGKNVNIEGKINATGGKIGNLTIDEVEQIGYRVIVESDGGFSFPQPDNNIKLIASVYDQYNNLINFKYKEMSTDFIYEPGKYYILDKGSYILDENEAKTEEKIYYEKAEITGFTYEWKNSLGKTLEGSSPTLTVKPEDINENNGGTVTYYCYVTYTTS